MELSIETKNCKLEKECRTHNKFGFNTCFNPIMYLDMFEKKCPIKEELKWKKE